MPAMILPPDPEIMPLDPSFEAEHGPAVDPARLTPSALRERFRAGREWRVEQSSDGRVFDPNRPVRPAAVLLGLIERENGLHVPLTVRASVLSDHAGQISFPGGGVDPQDADAIAAALREANEEIRLDANLVEVLGTLPFYRTVSRFQVTPVVALIARGAQIHVNSPEVEEVFEVPLSFFADGANFQRRIVVQEERPRKLFSLEYYGRRRYLIWGATAAMLRNFYQFLLA
jgi:8-oxo-dGTP pyrophosphatase MutT (NUDIX family)